MKFNADELEKAKAQADIYAVGCQATCYVVRGPDGLFLRNKRPFQMSTVAYKAVYAGRQRPVEPAFKALQVSRQMLASQARARPFHELPSLSDREQKNGR